MTHVGAPSGRSIGGNSADHIPTIIPWRMEISRYVDHPVYRYRDIEKLGRICKTEGSWTKTWPLEQLCTMCAPLVRSLLPFSFLPTLGLSLVLSSSLFTALPSRPFLFGPLLRASRSRLIRYIRRKTVGMESTHHAGTSVLLLQRGPSPGPPSEPRK